MEEPVVKQELSAQASPPVTPLKPRTAAAPGPSGHATPNLTSARLSEGGTQRAADNSSHRISAIPQQGPSPSSNQKTAEAHALSPSRGLCYGNKGQERALGCAVQTGRTPTAPLHGAVRTRHPPRDTAARSTPDSSDTTAGLHSNRNTTSISRAAGSAKQDRDQPAGALTLSASEA